MIEEKPFEIARETLKQLTTRKLLPTPLNYQSIYNEIAGIAQALPTITPLQQTQQGLLESAINRKGWDGKLLFEGLVIDPSKRSVHRQGSVVDLTSTEFDLLHLLAAKPGKVFSRDDILSALHGHEVDLYTRAVEMLVSRLRKKLEPLECIKTLRISGYALALAHTDPPSQM